MTDDTRRSGRPHTPWTEEECLLLRQMIESWLSLSQAADYLGRSKSSVRRQLAALGYVYNKPPWLAVRLGATTIGDDREPQCGSEMPAGMAPGEPAGV